MSPPRKGPASSIFVDARGEGRALRVTWHLEGPREHNPDGEGLVVLSLWRDNVCAGSFRLAASEVPALVETLTRGLSAQYDDLRTDTTTVPVAPALLPRSGALGDTG
ncbi:MAG: hypothetical protein ABIQ15_18020 [Nocardioides sp.]